MGLILQSVQDEKQYTEEELLEFEGTLTEWNYWCCAIDMLLVVGYIPPICRAQTGFYYFINNILVNNLSISCRLDIYTFITTYNSWTAAVALFF